MIARLQNKLRDAWDNLMTIGVYDSGDFTLPKRIKIIDTVSFLCLPVVLVFAALAFSAKHYYLTGFYVFLVFILALLVYGNHKIKGESFRIILISFIAVCCAAANVLFDNGQGYYVLLISFLSVLFYGLRKSILYLSVLFTVLYLATEVIKLYVPPIEPVVTFVRVIKLINVIITLSILVYFLYDIKRTYLKTLEETINKKKSLENYNALLVNQAVNLELKNKDILELKNKNEELSSIVYHQLRSPVVTFADVLSQYIEHSHFSKEEFVEISKLTQKKVTDTLHVIDNLLMWNRKGVDGIEPNTNRCELTAIINNTVSQLEILLEKKNLQILYPNKKNVFVYADADHVLIIMLNVLTNAIKFSPPGENINIEFIEMPGKCRLYISNSGKGIEESHLKSIFSTASIVSSNGTNNETGTGLGLKICKSLIEKNNGTIDIKSESNNVTTVMLELPVAV